MFVLSEVVLVVLTEVSSVLSQCGGYALKDVQLSSCIGKENVINVENWNIELNDECEMVSSGCVEATDNINEIQMTYMISKEFASGESKYFEGQTNPCSWDSNKINENNIEMVGYFALISTVLNNCKIQSGKTCSGHMKVNVAKSVNFFPNVEGHFKGNVTAVTNAGDICLELAYSFVKEN